MSNRNPTDMGGAFAGVPLCSRESCPSYDGKRCRETGNEPESVCVPEVRAIVASLASEPLCHGCDDNYNAHLAGDQGGCSGDFPEWWMRFRGERDDLRRRLWESTRVGLESVAAHARDLAERSAMVTAARDERNAAQDRALLLERDRDDLARRADVLRAETAKLRRLLEEALDAWYRLDPRNNEDDRRNRIRKEAGL